MHNFVFELPTRIEYGLGCSKRLATVLNDMQICRVLLVTDPGIQSAGLVTEITQQLDLAGVKWEVFDDVEANPKDTNVHKGAEKAVSLQVDGLIAIGGGSPIDCAKAMAVVATHGRAVRSFEDASTIHSEVLPLVAIPTTAGTGSEVTFSSVITDTQADYKFSIRHSRLAPQVALCDPELTVTMPPELTASTGMDALTHAIEAYTALVAEPLADACALYAIELITHNLVRAVSDGADLQTRAAMLSGSLLAGIAFSHSDVAAVHCIAEALGGKYDAPHGLCNAIVLPAVMQYNLEYCMEKYARIASAMGISFTDPRKGAQRAIDKVKQMAQKIHLPGFASLNVLDADLKELAHFAALNGSNPDNPRPMTEKDYLAVLNALGQNS